MRKHYHIIDYLIAVDGLLFGQWYLEERGFALGIRTILLAYIEVRLGGCSEIRNLPCVRRMHRLAQVFSTPSQAQLQISNQKLLLQHVKVAQLLRMRCLIWSFECPLYHCFYFTAVLLGELVSLQLAHELSLVLEHLILSHYIDVFALDALVGLKSPILI